MLALAYRILPEGYDEGEAARDLVFVGLVGMIDPLRDEAAAAIATCRQAGIRTMMITGDQPATAAEIGRQLGLDRDARGRALQTVHGRDLAALDGPRLANGSRPALRCSPASPRSTSCGSSRRSRAGERSSP